jgi:hypothetical protein
VSARTERWLSRADRLEDYWRDFAFLGLTETLHLGRGIEAEVQLLSLRMFVQLCAVKSPFLVGGEINPGDVAILLWRLTPAYDPRNKKARHQFIRSIAKAPFQTAKRVCDRYLDRMLIDRPPTTGKKSVRMDTSFAASMVHTLAANYGWSDEMILDLPMPRLFQYMRKIHRSINEDLAHFNPIRDKFAQSITAKILLNRKLQREANNHAKAIS